MDVPDALFFEPTSRETRFLPATRVTPEGASEGELRQIRATPVPVASRVAS